MSAESYDYPSMMQRALRGVVREALGRAAEEGLPGQHHFYVTLDTTAPGVDLPDWLREQYPKEITIVIQHEYWDLAVTPERFSVNLSFSNRAAAIAAPFDAVLTFVDPHAEFGLKFDPREPDEDPLDALDLDLRVPTEEPQADAEETRPEPQGEGADVVSLDRFRKT